MAAPANIAGESFRRRIYLVLEGGHAGGRAGEIVEIALIALILINVAAYVLQSIAAAAAHWRMAFEIVEFVSVAVFSVEYLLRLWSAPEDPMARSTGTEEGRLRYALRPMMVIDFLAIAPAYVAIFIPFVDLRVLRLVRLLRLLKIARYSPALATLAHVVQEERRALFGTLLLLLCATIFAAAAMHAAEGSAQPEAFGSIPEAMWWAIATLTTVGYGDVVPVTPLGRIIAGMTMIAGLGLFALPVGIIATGFVQTIHRRDFVVTLGMLARAPLFAGLDAATLSEVMNRLQARHVAPGTVISARGDPAHAFYLLISGEIEVELASRSLRFGPGTFFGELAYLHQTMRRAAVIALTQCRLVTLAGADFDYLMRLKPELQQRLRGVAAGPIEEFCNADEQALQEAKAAGFWSEATAAPSDPDEDTV